MLLKGAMIIALRFMLVLIAAPVFSSAFYALCTYRDAGSVFHMSAPHYSPARAWSAPSPYLKKDNPAARRR